MWKDCNRDGYIGMADNAVVEYRAELLRATYGESICKPEANIPSTPPTGKPPIDWMPPHNDGAWVREFISLGWLPAERINGDPNPWDLNDNESRLWADYGTPETLQYPSLACWYAPHPRGTYHSTGGLVQYASCLDGYRTSNAWNFAVETIGGDDLGLGQLSFKDQPYEQGKSASVLNQKTWGEDEDDAFVETWDCSQPYVVNQQVVVPAVPQANQDEETVWVNVSQPRVPPSGPNMQGSGAGTVNSTYGGLGTCARDGGGLANTPYALEGDVTQGVVKRQVDAVMYPTTSDDRPAAPYAALLGKGGPYSGTVPDMGLRVTSSLQLWVEGVSRQEAAPITGRGELMDVQYNTFYGWVSPAAVSKYGLTLPKGTATGAYGAAICENGIGPGRAIQKGFDCDPNNWYKDAFGDSTRRESPSGRYLGNGVLIDRLPGDLYNIRDIDCYDQSVKPLRAAGVHSGVIGDTECKQGS